MLIIFIWMIILAVRKGKSLKQLLVKGLHLSSEIICFFEEVNNIYIDDFEFDLEEYQDDYTIYEAPIMDFRLDKCLPQMVNQEPYFRMYFNFELDCENSGTKELIKEDLLLLYGEFEDEIYSNFYSESNNDY